MMCRWEYIPILIEVFFFFSPRSAKIYVIVKNGWIFSYLGIIAQKIYP